MVTAENPLRTASELAQAGRAGEAIACLESALARTRSDKERPANTSLLARIAGLHCEVVGRLSQAALYYEEAVAGGWVRRTARVRAWQEPNPWLSPPLMPRP
ncbi:hypothetical protein KH5H1_45920 [Corallococcus caeni]|nr:hypothetical protein KH5H1_45920 [Corallococcus sp. KH5-1]